MNLRDLVENKKYRNQIIESRRRNLKGREWKTLNFFKSKTINLNSENIEKHKIEF